MDKFFNIKNMPRLALFCGGLGILLRLWYLSTEDDRGFLARGHISMTLLLALTAVLMVLLFVGCRYLRQGNKYSFNFPASAYGGIGAALAGLGIGLASVVELLTGVDQLELLTAVLGIVAAASLVFVGHSRWKGLHPNMLFHTVICLYLMLRLLCMYRSCSANPQLADYGFELLALVCSMLSSYHRATFDANFGARAPHVFFSLAAVYFCLVALPGDTGALMYMSLGVWMFTDLCNLTPMPRELWEEEK